MARPQLLPTHIPDGQGPGLAYRVEGELVPSLHFSINGAQVLHEHHVLLWKQPQVSIDIAPLGGLGKSFKRVLAGMPVFFTYAHGIGEFALSRDQPGQLVPLHLDQGQAVLAREHAFLAAIGMDYSFERVQGLGSMLFGSQGFFVDRFTGGQGGGIVFLHAHGNAMEVTLEPGEQIDVEPGSWLYRDASVGYQQQVFGLKTGLFSGGGNMVWNRFTGPGRVGLQTGYFYGETTGAAAAGGGAAAAGVKGGILGAALGSILDN